MPDHTPAASTHVSNDDLRLVLFGMPAAGKSSLLGALARAAESQEHLLGGKLIDESQGLAELRHQLYEATPRRTPEEVVPYPVRYEPHPTEGDGQAPKPLDLVLMDCDGRVANDLLVRRKEIGEDSPEGTLAHEVIDADTLILVIDASAPVAQVEADFAEFVRFVRGIERGRKQRSEVSGLPIFLVLTKCDLLARPEDSPADWMERIEQRKREVDAHFREFVARGVGQAFQPDARNTARSASEKIVPAPSAGEGIAPARSASEGRETASQAAKPELPDSPFGRINLRIWATAVKRPQLAGSPAKPRDPYGVAELFRQCLTEAQEYRHRRRRSQRRLLLMVTAMAILLVGMIGLTAALWWTSQTGRAGLLAARVEDYRVYNRGGVAERLKGPPAELRLKLSRLEEIRDDPSFPRLKAGQREFVEERIVELTRYTEYLEKLLAVRPLSSEQTEDALTRRLERLRAELAVPNPDWEPTQAGERHKEMVESTEALRRGVSRASNWYLDQSDAAAKLWTFADYLTGIDAAGIDWADWTTRAEKLIDPGRRPPFSENDPLAANSTLTYSLALRIDRVVETRTTWESDRTKVRRLLDVCSALGLSPASKERPALLVFGRGFTLEQAKDRVAELKKFYPEYPATFARKALPDAVLPKVRQVAHSQYLALLTPGRAEVLRQLKQSGPGTEETAAKWDGVRKWLKSAEELSSWNVLAGVVQKLESSSPTDPIKSMAEFLAKGDFTLAPKTLVLELPDSRNIEPRAEARLLIFHPASKRSPGLGYEPSGEPRRDLGRRVWIYTFRLNEGQRIKFEPGDELWAELKLRGGKEQLVWSQMRSSLYRFERLRSAPRVQMVGSKSLEDGRLVDGARLVITPDDSVPSVPDLMPDVRGRE